MDSSVIIPFVQWNDSCPTFRISTICVPPNCEKLVTGSYSGQLCLWDLNLKTAEAIPRNLLLCHTHSVTCMVCTNEFIISSCEGGEICRWNLDDGYCSKRNRFLFVHRHMQLFTRSLERDELLITCGDYSEIFIINPFTLQVTYVLNSKSDFNWISNFHVIASQIKKTDIISGITLSGCIKFWVIDDLQKNSLLEINSSALQIEDVIDIKFSPTHSELLIVSANYWTLFDLDLLNCNHKIEVCQGEKLLGGNFCKLDIVVWTNLGKFYLYTLTNKPELISVISSDVNEISLFEPAMTIFQNQDFKYFVRGDFQGNINIWKGNFQQESELFLFATFKKNWVTSENAFFRNFLTDSNAACCIYVSELNKFVIGCFDGTIIIIPAAQSLFSFCFCATVTKPSSNVLFGHYGKINCLLYPYEKYSHFHKSYLVSGGSDFCVCLWDIINEELLHKFCVQGGEIISLMVPPSNCNTLVKYSICSVSSDHSVAVLNLKDKRCVILASRHLFPVVSVHWKPLDDYIIIECYDGTVYVWQMETGHLDRVLDGIAAKEVIYGCDEPILDSSNWNFYIKEDIIGKNSINYNFHKVTNAQQTPFRLHKFLTNELCESHILDCNLEQIIAQISTNWDPKPEILECAINQKIYLLTQAVYEDVHKKSLIFLDKIIQETENYNEKLQCQRNEHVLFDTEKNSTLKDSNFVNETMLKMIQVFLSSIHMWGLNPSLDKLLSSELGIFKPDKTLPRGIFSNSGAYSLFLADNDDMYRKSSTMFATTCIAVIALAKVLESTAAHLELSDFGLGSNEKKFCISTKKWSEVSSFYEIMYINQKKVSDVTKPKIEIMAKACQVKCLELRNIAWKLLTNYLQALDQKENVELLNFWYKYLPHFKILDKTSWEKVDFENLDLKTISLVLFGTAGSELKFKSNDVALQENYIYQTCASLVYLLFLPVEEKIRFGDLQSIAIEFLGRGYIIWEQFLKMEEVVPILFQICTDYSKITFGYKDLTAPFEKCLTALNALKAIAIARTAAFINCLINEINKIRSGLPRSDHFPLENSKPEIFSIISFLLEKSPYIMLLYLNDVISIFIYCIDQSHLKQENLANLVPVMQKFRQVHHSVPSQRIAVGLATGSLVLHDLRSGKAHEIFAHKDSVSALKFSEDGKFLASYSCYENRISFWQIMTGIFGLGHLQLKCIKTCQTYPIHDEEIRNHLEIASITWIDRRSIALKLCDGTENIFHS